MPFPLIPILALLAIFGGTGTLVWYESLSSDDQDQANELTAYYAERIFHKTVAELTKDEAQAVHRLTRAHFG